eukprot:gnl/MRDRNA2_/MRDRNA2_21722_c0_seq1.p1 gnl/MRDRNA2_/MRDRNA2_21722_c0~~gnl/MRDRNA2_/MRDRNA2_21722_c0_seq1.p1  ORF type:complete len:750 (-),score=98.56 gnl/MRDRNA2_/MRDRNA2_21722_c0_seq1:20-2005(-)
MNGLKYPKGEITGHKGSAENRRCPPVFVNSSRELGFGHSLHEQSRDGSPLHQWTKLLNFTASQCEWIFEHEVLTTPLIVAVEQLSVKLHSLHIGLREWHGEHRGFWLPSAGGSSFEVSLESDDEIIPCHATDFFNGSYAFECRSLQNQAGQGADSKSGKGSGVTCKPWWMRSWRLNLALMFTHYAQFFGFPLLSRGDDSAPSREPLGFSLLNGCPLDHFPELNRIREEGNTGNSEWCKAPANVQSACGRRDITGDLSYSWSRLPVDKFKMIEERIKVAELPNRTVARNHLGLQIQGCDLRLRSKEEIGNCMGQYRHVVLLGDSHLRFVFDTLAEELGIRVELDSEHGYHHYGHKRELIYYHTYSVRQPPNRVSEMHWGHFTEVRINQVFNDLLSGKCTAFEHKPQIGCKQMNDHNQETPAFRRETNWGRPAVGPGKPYREDLQCDLGTGYWECDPNSLYPCCSPGGWCGNSPGHCTCDRGCKDYRSSSATYDPQHQIGMGSFPGTMGLNQTTGRVLLVIQPGEWDLLLYGLDTFLSHVDIISQQIASVLQWVNISDAGMSVEVLWLLPVPTPWGKDFKKRGHRNNAMKQAAAEYIKLRVRELKLPSVRVIDTFSLILPRAEDTCKINNNHYLCAGSQQPQGEVGYWGLYQATLAYICDGFA